jgi:HSP20 family protein
MSPEPQLATRQAPAVPVRLQEIHKLFQEMEDRFQEVAKRAYELFERRGKLNGYDREDWFQAESELLQPVPIELEDREKEVVVRADVPGFKAEELEVAVEPGRVLIRGKSESKKEEKKKGKVVYSEQRASEISRALALPAEVVPEQANAVLKDGRLEITILKSEGRKVSEKKVPVKAA